MANPIAEVRETVAVNLRHRETEELIRARKRLERNVDFGDMGEIIVHMGTTLAINEELQRRQAA